MEETRRECQRIPVKLEAELLYNHATCFAYIENISERGIYAKITCIERVDDFKPDTEVSVKFQSPAGQLLQLQCKEKWSKKNISNSIIEQIGMEILDPSEEYENFYQTMKSAS
jgi:hypothetical protein